jgi:hypothetical protein
MLQATHNWNDDGMDWGMWNAGGTVNGRGKQSKSIAGESGGIACLVLAGAQVQGGRSKHQ